MKLEAFPGSSNAFWPSMLQRESYDGQLLAYLMTNEGTSKSMRSVPKTRFLHINKLYTLLKSNFMVVQGSCPFYGVMKGVLCSRILWERSIQFYGYVNYLAVSVA